MLFALTAIELYVLRKNPEGIRYLIPEERLDAMKPLCTLYGVYIGGILIFWYTKPFRPPRSDKAKHIRFWLAIACTVILNVALLFYVWQIHMFGFDRYSALESVQTGVKLAGLLSFLVGPVNLYYFGMKPMVAS